MANEVSARSEILRRVRAATGKAAVAEEVTAKWAAIPRRYKRAGLLSKEQVVELLDDRLRDYDARVSRIEASGIAQEVARKLAERGQRRLIVPESLPGEWLPAGYEFVVDNGQSAAEINELDGVVTGATVAIAETGTLVLQNVAGQGRRAVTLVPDYHLCIVFVKDIVETVPEAMDRLRATSALATTFISGPSATADIEMTRIKGVHGPRHLDVILVM